MDSKTSTNKSRIHHQFETFHRNIYHLLYYTRYVVPFGLTYPTLSPDLRSRLGRVKISKPFLGQLVPSFYTFLFGLVRASLVLLLWDRLDSVEKRLWLCTEMHPESARRNMEIPIICWAIMHQFYIHYVLGTDILEYQVVAVFLVDQNGSEGVNPRDLDLTQDQCHKLVRMRRTLLAILHSSTYGVVAILMVGLAREIIIRKIWTINLPLVIFWLIAWFIWIFYAASFSYCMPVLLEIIAHYICLKQKSLQLKLSTLITRLDRIQPSKAPLFYASILNLTERYTRVMSEVALYNRLVSRALNVIFSLYSILITYLIYILFFSKTSNVLILAYFNALATEVLLFSVTIYGCAGIVRCHQEIGLLMYQLVARCYAKGTFTPLQMAKLDSVTQELLGNVGFTLYTGYTVDSNAYFIMIYLISTFFFLVFRQGHY